MTNVLTDLDRAHEGSDDNDAARLRFYSVLADAELFILLERPATDTQFEPQMFPVDGQDYVLAFDTEERLADFASKPVPYAALPGRIVAGLLAEQGVGLALNLEVAPSSTLLPPDALAWLTEMLGGDGPGQTEARIDAVMPPAGVPDVLLMGLAERLARTGRIADAALLAKVQYDGGGTGHLLALVGADTRAEPALARAVSEAVTFSGVEAGFLDVGFFAADDPVVARLRAVAFAFELPEPEPVQEVQAPGRAPGMDPDKPPRLH